MLQGIKLPGLGIADGVNEAGRTFADVVDYVVIENRLGLAGRTVGQRG